MPRPRILLHVCCVNCLLDTIPAISDRGWDVHLFFFNPNIQPLLEYRKRRKSFLLGAERLGLPLHERPAPSPRPDDFLKQVEWASGKQSRCRSCYRIRLSRTAEEAAGAGFDAFLSTLQVSGLQDSRAVLEAGEEAAARFGARFIGEDLSGNFGKGRPPSGFHPYRQQYCGCIFSEFERFSPTRRHLTSEERRR